MIDPRTRTDSRTETRKDTRTETRSDNQANRPGADKAREHDDAAAKHASPTTDTLIAAFGERLSAQVERGGSTLRLALAETRLAAVSAAALLGLAVAAALMGIVIWLLLAALAGYGLWALGLSPPAALGLLLVIHLIAVGVMGWIGTRLAADLRFAHTRRVLTTSASDTAAAVDRDAA